MRKWVKPFVWLLLSLLSLLLLCRFCGVTAEATTYVQMTPEEAYNFYGDSIACTYYNGTTYVQTQLVPSALRRVYYRADSSSYGENIPDWLGYNTTMQYVYYYAVASDYSSNPSYLGVDIAPNVHFSGCTDFRFAAFAYCGNNHVPNTSAGYSDSFVYVNNLRFSNADYVSASGWYPAIQLTRTGTTGDWSVFGVWADYHSDVISTANLLRLGFNGARLDGDEIGVYLSLPQYNTGAVPGTGTEPVVTTSPIPEYNVTVYVSVDNQVIESQLDDYLGGDDPSITTFPTADLGTYPTIDLNALESNTAVMSVDVNNVAQRLSDGTGGVWKLCELIMNSFPFIQWLLPCCILLSITAWVLWRKGG